MGQSQSQAGNQLFPTEAAAPEPQTRILTLRSRQQAQASELRVLGSGGGERKPRWSTRTGHEERERWGEADDENQDKGQGKTGIKKTRGRTEERRGERRKKKNGENNS